MADELKNYRSYLRLGGSGLLFVIAESDAWNHLHAAGHARNLILAHERLRWLLVIISPARGDYGKNLLAQIV